jgi:hypothetical protein
VSKIIARFGVHWVQWNDVDGAGLAKRNNELLPAAEFLDLVIQASQYDWAFFFMFVEKPAHSTLFESDDKEKLARADITVRLVDDTFVFVYSRSDEVARQIQSWYPAAAQSQVKLENLKIPY